MHYRGHLHFPLCESQASPQVSGRTAVGLPIGSRVIVRSESWSSCRCAFFYVSSLFSEDGHEIIVTKKPGLANYARTFETRPIGILHYFFQ